MIKKILRYVKKPKKVITYLVSRNIIKMKDKTFLKLEYENRFNKKLDLENPKTFNEKIQWLKLYNRNPEYVNMVDKYMAKKHVANIIGEEYIIPTLGVWNNFDEIDFDKLPQKFVLKCTHDSGGVVICKDKEKFDIEAAKKKINKSLKRNFYYVTREWVYKDIKPRIIAEQYMENENEDELNDYKFFCFDGDIKTILVCSNRKGNNKNTDFYDVNWNLLPYTREKYDNNPNGNEKPEQLSAMIDIAKKLSNGIPFVRVDLYQIKNKVYFGELTFYPSAGFEGFRPKSADDELGEFIKISQIKGADYEK